MSIRDRNNPGGSEPGRSERNEEGLSSNPLRENTSTGGAFNETQRTGYGSGISSSPSRLSPGSTSSQEEGDEDYDDEDQEKNFDDYNRAYKQENSDL